MGKLKSILEQIPHKIYTARDFAVYVKLLAKNDEITNYFIYLYLGQYLLTILTDYLDNDLNPFDLTPLMISNLKKTVEELLLQTEQLKQNLESNIQSTILLNHLIDNNDLVMIEKNFNDNVKQINSLLDSDTEGEEVDSVSSIKSLKKNNKDSFSYKDIINSSILSYNFLIDFCLPKINSVIELISSQEEPLSKEQGRKMILLSYLLELSIRLFPEFKNFQTNKLDNNPIEINLQNVKELSNSTILTNEDITNQPLLKFKDIKRKIKYSRIIGLQLNKCFKSQIPIEKNHELNLALMKYNNYNNKIKEEVTEEDVLKIINEVTNELPEIPNSETVEERKNDNDIELNNVEKNLPRPPSDIASRIAKEVSMSARIENTEEEENVDTILNKSSLIDEAKKCCRFAISSLEFEDPITALKELKESIKLIEKYQEI